jgi:hypothetical protein
MAQLQGLLLSPLRLCSVALCFVCLPVVVALLFIECSVSSRLAMQEHAEIIEEKFAQYDTNKQGTLDRIELAALLKVPLDCL